jgi:pyruvate dehydrogenase E1 component alpha subunit
MAKACIDGNDVRVVYDAVMAAAERARAGAGPTLVEALTYRHKGHSRTDPGTYRPPEEVELWLTRDPIPRLEEDLRSRGAAVDGIREAAEAEIAAALERARAWDEPAAEARLEDALA